MAGYEDQAFPMADLIGFLVAGLAGFGLAFIHRLKQNSELSMTLLFLSVFLAVVSVALGGPLALVALAAGALLIVPVYLIEWLMPLPQSPPPDEDEES